nr:hypothetical protein [uncultured Duncaniella sp.]
MKKTIISTILLLSLGLSASAQNPGHNRRGEGDREAAAKEMQAKMKEEANAYYANADTAEYGIRYRLKYLFNKEKNLTFEEDRIVLITPKVTLYQSYEGIGETRWRLANPNGQGGDLGLA